MQARYAEIDQLLSLIAYVFDACRLHSRMAASRPRCAVWPVTTDWANAGAPTRVARIAAVMSCFIAHLHGGSEKTGIHRPILRGRRAAARHPFEGSWFVTVLIL